MIEVEVKDFTYLQVIYSDDKKNLNNEKDILTHKSSIWEYEHEWRYLKEDTSDNNHVVIGTITKIYFGTPYEKLNNYEDIKDKHKDLQKYHCLKEELVQYCKNNKIKCDDYKFDDPDIKKNKIPYCNKTQNKAFFPKGKD